MIWDLRECQAELPEGRLLVLADANVPMVLEGDLQALGMTWDLTDTLVGARQLFFAWGGHDALIIAPGTVAGLAREVTRSLRHMDPDLPVLTFLDPSILGGVEPAPITLADLGPGTELGLGLFRQRLLTSINRARS